MHPCERKKFSFPILTLYPHTHVCVWWLRALFFFTTGVSSVPNIINVTFASYCH